MTLVSLGTRSVIQMGTSIGFYLPKEWVRENDKGFWDWLYSTSPIMADHIRYYMAPGVGRTPRAIRTRASKPAVTLPAAAAKRLGIARYGKVKVLAGRNMLVVKREE